MKLIAALVVMCPCGALADIVYTAGTQLSQGAVWTDLSPGAPPETSFSVSGGLEPVDGAVQDVIVSRQAPTGHLFAAAGVGYFGVHRDTTHMVSEMQSTAEFEIPDGESVRIRGLALITLDFTLTAAGPVFLIGSVANNDIADLGITHTTIPTSGSRWKVCSECRSIGFPATQRICLSSVPPTRLPEPPATTTTPTSRTVID